MITRKTDEEMKERAVATGLALGLPEDWLRALPEIRELPGNYLETDYGKDAFLSWKRQELLVRTGRFEAVDRALVADALEGAAAKDGPAWLHKQLRELMFLLAWPERNYLLHVDLRTALDLLRACLKDSPSMDLFAQSTLESAWQSARFELLRLDDSEPEPPEASPWPSLRDLTKAAAQRLRRDRRRFRQRRLSRVQIFVGRAYLIAFWCVTMTSDPTRIKEDLSRSVRHDGNGSMQRGGGPGRDEARGPFLPSPRKEIPSGHRGIGGTANRNR
jgi:hypothetical protein